MHDLCMRPVSGRYDSNIQPQYVYTNTTRTQFLSPRKPEPSHPITQARLPFASRWRLIVIISPCRNNSVTSGWRDRDTSHRDRKNWNTVVIDPTSIARVKKRLDITVRWARNAKARLPVTPAIPWMYHRQDKVSPPEL